MPSIVEPFNIYEDKKEELNFQIYEDKIQTEAAIILRNTLQEKLNVESNIKSECLVKEEKDKLITEIQSKAQNGVDNYRPILQEIKQENIFGSKGSPMSMDKSCLFESETKKDSRAKREACKISRTNYYDIDEYRADIYHYFRSVEVSLKNFYNFFIMNALFLFILFVRYYIDLNLAI